MTQKAPVPQRIVLIAALVSEGVMLLLTLLWSHFRGVGIELSFSSSALLGGLKATGPLLVFNFGVFVILINRSRYSIYREFFNEIIVPLCGNLNFVTIAFVALAAGIGEEFMFRALINTELSGLLGTIPGVIIGSFLFAYVHFIGIAIRFWPIVLFYFLFGLYFSYLYLMDENILIVVIAHAGYNFVAMNYVRYVAYPRVCANGQN